MNNEHGQTELKVLREELKALKEELKILKKRSDLSHDRRLKFDLDELAYFVVFSFLTVSGYIFVRVNSVELKIIEHATQLQALISEGQVYPSKIALETQKRVDVLEQRQNDLENRFDEVTTILADRLNLSFTNKKQKKLK